MVMTSALFPLSHLVACSSRDAPPLLPVPTVPTPVLQPVVYTGSVRQYHLTVCICSDGSVRVDALSTWHKDSVERKHFYLGTLDAATHTMRLRDHSEPESQERTANVRVVGDWLIFDRLPLWYYADGKPSPRFGLRRQHQDPLEIERAGAVVFPVAVVDWYAEEEYSEEFKLALHMAQIDYVTRIRNSSQVVYNVLRRDLEKARAVVASYRSAHPDRPTTVVPVPD